MPRNAPLILLYGANGYTGKLSAQILQREPVFAALRDKIVLAGRSEAKVKEVADANNLPYRIFSLEGEEDEIDVHLQDVRVVVHMAGPFIYTAEPMLTACVRNQCDYLDITGEQPVMQLIHETYAQEITNAGILAISGVGFDIVPTDCLAKRLAEALPGATHLDLAICNGPGAALSRGTALTSFEHFATGRPMCARVNGEMKNVGVAYTSRRVPFPTYGTKNAMFLPWGDCYSAYFSTGIPNTNVFFPAPALVAPFVYYGSMVGAVALKWIPGLHCLISAAIPKIAQGPAHHESNIDVWGEVRDVATGRVATGAVIVPEGYLFTARAALLSAIRVFDGAVTKKAGPATPSVAFGAKFVNEIEGVTELDVVVRDVAEVQAAAAPAH
ncbi:hypothetical protein AMAG_07569 [Allomyces macrogynus ATCC 38327]|uniref:Saccharopine dehydrogenase NADP binding domain-containing protein n=1 Tax=Allomyces macrogynus (strain ATCC 38327) TaxID=578462 RepID=A0A0L0SIR4_ALLM3|nr:hypothetical protein AMAG_07569 [Allomyces macrogynus ATCC 38327]|eukprot:KNE62339.1 hypothetical protein AMAG_07569 [Allomyces macrogynus ATCC 38327]